MLPVRDVPAAKTLPWRVRNLALAAPGIEPVIDRKAGQMLDGKTGRRDGGAVKLRIRQHPAGNAHHLAFYERKLIALRDDLPPFIDLLVNIDLDRADIRAARVERRGKWEIAVFAHIEGRIDDHPDRTRIGCAVTQS